MTFGGSFCKRSLIGTAAAVLLLVLTVVPAAEAQFPELQVTVGDTTGLPNEINTVISLFLQNFQDTVAGFNIWIQLDRPDIMLFQTNDSTVIDTSYWDCLVYEDDTVCVESVMTNPLGEWDYIIIDTGVVQVGSWDTTGTLISGWQAVKARSLSGSGYDLNIAGIANMPDSPFVHGIPPQQTDTPLIKLMADVLDVPDTLIERTVNILVQHDFIDHFSWSRPDGSLIGIQYEEQPDTNYYVCVHWAGDVCLDWKRVSTPPADSIEPHTDTVAVIDTVNVLIDDGSLTVEVPPEGFCGDVDNGGEEEPNVADLTALVAYLFAGGPPAEPMWKADVDCEDGPGPNVADLTYLVAYLFAGGPVLCPYC